METTISQESIVARLVHKAILVIAIVLAWNFFLGFTKPYTLEQAHSLILGMYFILRFLILMSEKGLKQHMAFQSQKRPNFSYEQRLMFYRIMCLIEPLFNLVLVFLIHYGSKLLVQIVS